MRVQASQTEPLLQAEKLTQVYGGMTIVSVDAIDIRAGEVLAMLGPNGAGKSTLMRLLAGLERPASGVVRFKGREISVDDRAFRRTSVAMLQRPYLWRGTVRENVEYGLKIRGIRSSERVRRVRDVLEQLGVEDLLDAPIETLSVGEAKRVALARALAPESELLFLDEPTADLDVTVRKSLLSNLERIVSGADQAIVLITHDPGEAFALADRVVVFENGAIVQAGTPAELFERPATEFIASFTGAEFSFSGRVADAGDGTVIVRLDSGHLLEAQGSGAKGMPVRVTYRPEDVVIAPSSVKSETSARNRFLARVVRLNPRGGLVRLRLDADELELEAIITHQSLIDLGLKVGSSIVAQIKATALHSFPA